jgi:ATP-dependent Lon protease
MRGFIINRTGKHKHVFKAMLKPNERLDLRKLYTEIYSRKKTEAEFLDHVKKYTSSIDGLSLEDLDESPIEAPAELLANKETGELPTLSVEEIKKLTPTEVANLPYDPEKTKDILSNIDSSRTLTYALTLLKKKNKSKRMQRALEKRIIEIQS